MARHNKALAEIDIQLAAALSEEKRAADKAETLRQIRASIEKTIVKRRSATKAVKSFGNSTASVAGGVLV